MSKRKKTLSVIGAVVVGAALSQAPDAQAFQHATNAGTRQALEQFLREHPTSDLASEAVRLLIADFSFAAAHGASTLDDAPVGILGY